MTWFEFDSFRFEQESRILTQDGRPVALAPKAADLLSVFLEEPGNLLSKGQLKQKVWPDLGFVEDNTLFFQISCVRDALGEKTSGKKYIENLTRRGYRFVVPVHRVHSANGNLLTASAIASVPPDTKPDQVSTLAGPSKHARWLGTRRWAAFSAAGIVVAISLVVMVARGFAPAGRI